MVSKITVVVYNATSAATRVNIHQVSNGSTLLNSNIIWSNENPTVGATTYDAYAVLEGVVLEASETLQFMVSSLPASSFVTITAFGTEVTSA
jgi:hypothetical protein